MAELQVESEEVLMARFEELSVIETEFEDVELEIIRKAEALHAPLYTKRADYIKKIPHFWSLSRVLSSTTPNGSPRSFALKFGFKENEYFEDKVLEKKFWFRKSRDWAGLVSEPVQIHWKKGKDLTGGLTDAAFKLGEARKKLNSDSSDMAARKKETELPEYKELSKKIETSFESSISFFGLFSFVSGYRWISAEESAKAEKEDKEKLEKIKRGEKLDEDEDEEEDSQDYQEVEVFHWRRRGCHHHCMKTCGQTRSSTTVSALKARGANTTNEFTEATFDEEEDDEDLSDLDVEGMDDSEVEAMVEDDSDEQEVDIRALVGKGRKSDVGPPAKKQRKK
ncbi:hypothetical protein SNOG_15495 [Parastagonospora nodorum SN15]|uniref:NAP family protein n=1 Tax=Phaeosphaeria nodorum (strain SN15 / ATCC MYA-4574 / FGSC 10173) TaxID=321614 RepID=Q0TYG2_PHANO|nr:hypothetical protein SNOG_15495 [Parastagonospora nodorum SN15]EAT77160.2 hypothetical protein SNOG_15495 [Parastagonospora nodorum SN15]